MINRDSRGHLYSIVRGEILGFIEDKLLRKHLPRMFSLISERKLGDRRRSIAGMCLVVHSKFPSRGVSLQATSINCRAPVLNGGLTAKLSGVQFTD